MNNTYRVFKEGAICSKQTLMLVFLYLMNINRKRIPA